MISLRKKTAFALFILTIYGILQSSEKQPYISTLPSIPQSPSGSWLRIWEASKSSQAYQEKQMRKIREKMEQEKAATSPK